MTLDAGAVLLQPVGDHAGALIRTRRAAVRLGRNGHGKDAARLHAKQHVAQLRGLRAGLPGMRHLGLGSRRFEAGDGVEVDPRGDDQTVIGELAAIGQADAVTDRIDCSDLALDQADAIAAGQVGVAVLQGSNGALAVEDQVAENVRGIGGVTLDQGNRNPGTAPQTQILGHRGTAHAAANDDNAAADTGIGGHGAQLGRRGRAGET